MHLREGRRGSAATWGGLAIVALIVASVLFYFDVIRIGNVLPEWCRMEKSLGCEDVLVMRDGIQVTFFNGLGRGMRIRQVKFESDALSGSCSTRPLDAEVIAEEKASFFANDSFGCSFIPTGKEKNRYDVEVVYSWANSPITRSIKGYFTALVRENGTLGGAGANGGGNPALAAEWRFDTPQGAEDSSESSNHASIVSAEWRGEGCKRGGCYEFDGVDDYIRIPASNSLNITSALTMAAWVSYADVTGISPQDVLLGKEGTPYAMALGDRGVECFARQAACPDTYKYNLVWYLQGISEQTSAPATAAGWRIGGGPVGRGVWQQVAVTYDGARVRSYINGEMVSEYAVSSPYTMLPTNSEALTMGGTDSYAGLVADGNSFAVGHSSFRGRLDEVFLFSRALSPKEIKALYSR